MGDDAPDACPRGTGRADALPVWIKVPSIVGVILLLIILKQMLAGS